jgi:peptidoglycan/LPS O-acetylase OafA/YrhL
MDLTSKIGQDLSTTGKRLLYAKFPALDGVRGLSVLWVVTHHIPVDIPNWLWAFTLRGDLGVELFFAISGFLVTRSLFQCVDKASRAGEGLGHVVWDFIVRRVSRIFPPYYFILFFLGLVALFFDSSLLQKLSSINDILWSFPLYLYNYTRFTTTGTVPGSLNIMWSLAFEEQFYIFLLVLFCLFRKRFTTALFIACGVSITARLLQVFLSPTSIESVQVTFFPHLRLDSILWGCLGQIFFASLYEKWHGNRIFTRLMGIAAFILPILITVAHQKIQDVRYLSVIYIFTALFYTQLILYMSFNPHSLLTRFFSTRFLVFVGVISYEIYLTHEIVLGVLVRMGVKQYPWTCFIGTIILSILVAWAFHVFFCKPTQRRLRRFLSAKTPHNLETETVS